MGNKCHSAVYKARSDAKLTKSIEGKVYYAPHNGNIKIIEVRGEFIIYCDEESGESKRSAIYPSNKGRYIVVNGFRVYLEEKGDTNK